MNAYELADKLWENYLDNNECEHGFALSSGCHNEDCKDQALYDSANMLRQQADRIAELERQQSSYQPYIATKIEPTVVSYTTPQTNAEPVAWAYETKNVDGKPYLSDVSLKPLFGLVTRYGYKEIPLYTTPQTKPLSDEEIEEVMMKVGYGEVHKFVNPFDFARAIEERILGK